MPAKHSFFNLFSASAGLDCCHYKTKKQMSTLVEIKQSADQSATTLGLDKYNRSKFPGTFEVVQPGRTPDNRWVTGIDENAVSVKSINDPVLRETRKEEIRVIREELERLTGLDLKGTSEYWNTYYIKIGEKLALNFDNPADVIKYYILLSNNYAAPELEAKNNPDFINTKFYMHRAENEEGQKAVKSRERDKAVADLYTMYDNRAKLTLIGRYILGSKVKDSMSADGIYNLLRANIESDKDGSIIRKFNDATSKTIEELQFKLVVDEAIARHVIRIREGYYQRGNATYGKTIKDVVKFLSSPENANEFASVKEEVEEKRVLG